MTIKEAKLFSLILYAVSVLPTLFINTECFLMFFAAAVATILYSAPPFRFKKNGRM